MITRSFRNQAIAAFAMVGLIIAVPGCAAPSDSTPVPWGQSLGLAMEAADQQDRLLLVSFDAAWCTICARMKRDTFSDKVVQAAMTSYALVSVDVDAQPHLARKYLVDAVPQQLILRPDGSVVARVVGYLDVDEMLRFLGGDGLSKPESPESTDAVVE